MLKEKIIYKDELPVNVITADIEEYPIHFHEDFEVVYVLDGTIKLKDGFYTYTLKQGDIFIINNREMHSFEGTGKPNMVMMLHLELSYFSRYYENLRNRFFITDLDDDEDESLDVLRGILARIMMEVIQKGFGYEDKVIESTHNLIGCLMSDFQYFVMDGGKFRNESRNKGNKILAGRLSRITDYMYDNYNRKLTLGEIADREHLSIYYLSHVIKEATGLSFQDFLSYIRVEESERLLLGTNKKIGAISEETDFSAVRYYIKHFENWFGMHPMEYRDKNKNKVSSREIEARYNPCTPAQIEGAIRHQVKGVYADYMDRMSAKPVIVDIDVHDDYSEIIKETPPLKEIMDRPANAVLAEPFMNLMSMEENVIAIGENYLVTTRCKFPGPIDSLSILVYNFDENVARSLRKIPSQEDLLRIAQRYNEEMEFLIRCTGLDGEYRIHRWRLDRENIMGRIERAIDPTRRMDTRQSLLMEMTEKPAVSCETIACSDMISLRSILRGLSAELILVDSK